MLKLSKIEYAKGRINRPIDSRLEAPDQFSLVLSASV